MRSIPTARSLSDACPVCGPPSRGPMPFRDWNQDHPTRTPQAGKKEIADRSRSGSSLFPSGEKSQFPAVAYEEDTAAGIAQFTRSPEQTVADVWTGVFAANQMKGESLGNWTGRAEVHVLGEIAVHLPRVQCDRSAARRYYRSLHSGSLPVSLLAPAKLLRHVAVRAAEFAEHDYWQPVPVGRPAARLWIIGWPRRRIGAPSGGSSPRPQRDFLLAGFHLVGSANRRRSFTARLARTARVYTSSRRTCAPPTQSAAVRGGELLGLSHREWSLLAEEAVSWPWANRGKQRCSWLRATRAHAAAEAQVRARLSSGGEGFALVVSYHFSLRTRSTVRLTGAMV